MKILLTAFDAFGGEDKNAAALALEQVNFKLCPLVKRILPTVFFRATRELFAEIEKEQPSAVLLMGQAGGRAEITPERVAINVMDARIPDNAGFAPMDEPIRAGGPCAYFSTLPIRAMTEKIQSAGIPAKISNTAGTFVCNSLMYGLLDGIALRGMQIRGGFMHVPFLPEQAEKKALPSLPLREIVRGVECALEAIFASEEALCKP